MLGFIIQSCQDIIKSDGTVVKERIYLPSISAEDSLGFLSLAPLSLDTVKLTFSKVRLVLFQNISTKYTINIYNIRTKHSVGFSVSSLYGFPIPIDPLQHNQNNPIELFFDSNNKPIGTYIDTLIINGSDKFFVPVKVVVIN